MLTLTHLSLATVEQLFRYKSQGFTLPDFPGYSEDQWGIKAHNRPWIEEVGRFAPGQRVLEVGGAYSLLPKYLGEKYNLEPWIGDDFGGSTDAGMWARWGDPRELPIKYPSVRYVFQPFGVFSPEYPDRYFDRIFSVSTLEHIPKPVIVDVFKDMHRCLRPGGVQIHTIDISPLLNVNVAAQGLYYASKLSGRPLRLLNGIWSWLRVLELSGVTLRAKVPGLASLIDRSTLVESADVVYRFFPPNNAPKPYRPWASLLAIIENRP